MRPGDDADFHEFVRGRWSALYRTAYLLTGQPQDAEDLLQGALANTYLAWSRVEEPAAYVRRAMVNGAARGWRRRDRVVLTEDVPDPGHDGGLDGLGERQELWAAVGTLPPRMRATLVLRYYEGLSEAETAAALDCSLGSVKSQTHHALRRLRQALGADAASLEESR